MKSEKLKNKKLIDKTQVKLIHVAKSHLKMPDEDYRALLSERYWAHSCKDLTYDEATNLLKHMQTMGFKIITKRHQQRKSLPPGIDQLPSGEIMRMIDHLKADVQWRIRPDGYERWLRKFLGVDRPRTMREAQKIVEALKGMKTRQNQPPRPAATPPYQGGELERKQS